MTPEGGFGLKPLKIVPISDKVVTTQAKKDKDKQNVYKLNSGLVYYC